MPDRFRLAMDPNGNLLTGLATVVRIHMRLVPARIRSVVCALRAGAVRPVDLCIVVHALLPVGVLFPRHIPRAVFPGGISWRATNQGRSRHDPVRGIRDGAWAHDGMPGAPSRDRFILADIQGDYRTGSGPDRYDNRSKKGNADSG